jgi:ribosomal protein S17E
MKHLGNDFSKLGQIYSGELINESKESDDSDEESAEDVKKTTKSLEDVVAEQYDDQEEEEDVVEETDETEEEEETVEEECGDDDDDEDTVEEDCCDDDDDEDDEKEVVKEGRDWTANIAACMPSSQVIEEGIFDRAKAKVGAAKDAVGDAGSYARSAMGMDSKTSAKRKENKSYGDPSQRFQDSKKKRILASHLKRINNDLSGYVTDLVKMGVLDEQAAESSAVEIST